METLLERWRARGRTLDVRGRQIFCVDTGGGDPDRPALLILHGFPSSSLDYHRVLDDLAAGYRVVVHDHVGFGFSAKPADYSYSLLEQAEVAFELWSALGVAAGHLLAHDYGTSVATEVLARRERGGIPVELASVTLANGSVLLDLARLRWSQRLARSPLWGPLFSRLVTRGYFRRVVRRLWGDRGRADRADLDAMWDGLREGDGHLRTTQISSYLDERVRFRHRWLGALRRLDVPAHLLWGRRDPVALPAVAERLAEEIPGARLTWLDELGHYPMLEDPRAWSRAALDFLEGIEP
jgi:pimeloyl-ACP methyl ester carboxylesterase